MNKKHEIVNYSEMTAKVEMADYSGLVLTIRQAGNSAQYDFIIENTGELHIWHFKMTTYALLDPGHFGLDDTHMPASMTNEERANISHLAPHQHVCLVRKKWGNLDRYRGPDSGAAFATFSFEQNNTRQYGAIVNFIVEGAKPYFSTNHSVREIQIPTRNRLFGHKWWLRWYYLCLGTGIATILLYYLFVAITGR